MDGRPPPTFDELESAWRARPAPPRDRGAVRLLCVRRKAGVHECPARVHVSPVTGVAGDRWAQNRDRDPERQVTLMSVDVAEAVAAGRHPLDAPGDNLLVDLDLSAAALPPGTRLRIGTAELEVSAIPHTGCKKFSERFGLEALQWIGHDKSLRLRGINCRVVSEGWVAVGDDIEVVSR